MSKQIISHRAAKLVPIGLQGFLWYLCETVDAPLQTFDLASGAKLQHITHKQSQTEASKEYEITIGSDEDFVTASLIVKKEDGRESMVLLEEYEAVNYNG